VGEFNRDGKAEGALLGLHNFGNVATTKVLLKQASSEVICHLSSLCYDNNSSDPSSTHLC